MLEYVFFNNATAERFIETLRKHAVHPELEGGKEEPLCVRVHEESITDELSSLLDALYDELLEESDFMGGEENLEKDLAGFEVALRDGTRVTVPVDTDLMKKLTSVLTLEEIQSLLAAIVQAVETRDSRPLCHFE